MMISKEQFLAIKKCQSEGMSMAAAAKKIGISVQTARKWAKLDEACFDELKRDDIPYMDQYREFILSIRTHQDRTGRSIRNVLLIGVP
ncbi:MAG: hypothetical protein IJW09_00295 [Clostridia bacterium]|nr:hypothetical protein [Clostridia bacterium]